MTSEFIPAEPDSAAGRRDQIKSTLHTMIDFKESLLDLISKAQSKDDHLTLGYSSWSEYVSTEYAGLLAKLDRADRRLASFALAEIGMSSRAISPLVGVSDRQVRSDVAQVGSHFPPDQDQVGSHFPPEEGTQSVTSIATRRQGCVVCGRRVCTGDCPQDIRTDPATPLVGGSRRGPDTVVGIDGKRYRAPKPKPARRKPGQKATPGAFWDAVHDLRKKLTTLENVVKRDTFARNRKAIREQHLADLIRQSNRLKAVISALSDPVDGDGAR